MGTPVFPKVDFSHLPSLHKILEETCEEFGIEYSHYPSPWILYLNMIETFRKSNSLMEEVFVYAGGI